MIIGGSILFVENDTTTKAKIYGTKYVLHRKKRSWLDAYPKQTYNKEICKYNIPYWSFVVVHEFWLASLANQNQSALLLSHSSQEGTQQRHLKLCISRKVGPLPSELWPSRPSEYLMRLITRAGKASPSLWWRWERFPWPMRVQMYLSLADWWVHWPLDHSNHSFIFKYHTFYKPLMVALQIM